MMRFDNNTHTYHGVFTWHVPTIARVGRTYRIKITSIRYENVTRSSAEFCIVSDVDGPVDGVHCRKLNKSALEKQEAMSEEEMELQRFFETVLAKDKLKDEEAERQAHDAAARSVTNEILGEVCEAMVRASYEDLMDTKNKIIGVLDRTVVDILLGTGKFREMLRIDGSEYLTFGLINDLRRKVLVRIAGNCI